MAGGMKRSLIFLCAAVIVVLAGCKPEYPGIDFVVISGERYTVELAVTEEQRAQGMSARDHFPEGGVMLFAFPDEQVRGFWMYECLIDIDIMFLDGRGIVTATHRMPTELPRQEDETEEQYMARLPNYSSRLPAQFAIELPSGSLDRLGVRVDDRIELDLDRLKALAE